MKKILAAAIFMSTLFIMSCSSKSDSDPKTVLSNFFEALAKKDFKGAKKFATESSKDMLDMLETTAKMVPDSKDEKSEFEKSNLEIGEVKMDGDKATVSVKNKAKGQSVNYSLKKEKGEWKVAFDKASMMEMEKGSSSNNSSTENVDSLTNDLKKSTEDLNNSMKALDSLK